MDLGDIVRTYHDFDRFNHLVLSKPTPKEYVSTCAQIILTVNRAAIWPAMAVYILRHPRRFYTMVRIQNSPPYHKLLDEAYEIVKWELV